MCQFRLVVQRPGSKNADFVDFVTFDQVAKTVAEYLTKGRRVAIIGRLCQSTWTTAEGEKRSSGVVADPAIFLDQPKTAASDDDEQPAERPAVGRYRKSARASPDGTSCWNWQPVPAAVAGEWGCPPRVMVAKTVGDHLTKGRLVAIIGRLRQSTWTTVEGEKRSKLGVVADGVVFLDSPKAKAGSDEPPAERPAVGRYRKSA